MDCHGFSYKTYFANEYLHVVAKIGHIYLLCMICLEKYNLRQLKQTRIYQDILRYECATDFQMICTEPIILSNNVAGRVTKCEKDWCLFLPLAYSCSGSLKYLY